MVSYSEGPVSSLTGTVHILLGGGLHFADDRLVLGVDGLELLPAGGINELSVNEELGGEADVHLVHEQLLAFIN